MYAHITEPLTGEQPRIATDKAVRLRFWARESRSGELLQFGEDLTYLHGGYGGVFPKIEAQLSGCGLNERIQVRLSPEEGYGEYRPDRLILQPRANLPEAAAEIGRVLHGELPDGAEHPYIVVAVDEDSITLDGNHPWAGKHLEFTFEIMEIRDSIEAERRAGFPFDL